jgi:OPT family oligopeptide transporter
MAAVGVLVGTRAAASLFLGSVLSYGVLAPWTLSLGWATPGPDDPSKPWFAQLSGSWLLWPGVAMMVSSSIASLAFSWRSMARSFRRSATPTQGAEPDADEQVSRRTYLGAVVCATAFATATQVVLFGITWWTAVLGTLLTFVLALVAGRVTGETNVTPVGAMGKVTQLLFGLIQPGSATANLMAANVTGGAASQTGDLLHDLKTGALLGASPRKQAVAQTFGALSGALCGSAAYLVIVPDPRGMLGTDEWPAPAVQTWKAVAELFMRGIEAAAPGTVTAMFVAGAAGIALAVLEKTLPKRWATWVPSPASMGLGFVIPAYQGLSMLAGALLGAAAGRWAKTWSERFAIVLAAGFIAGESLTGVGIAIERIASAGGGH